MKNTARNPVRNRGADYSPSPNAAPPPGRAGEFAVPADHAGLRLDQSVARLLPAHSRNRLQGWLRDGRILVDGERRDPKDKVWGGECLRVFAADEAAPAADRAEPIGLQIAFEDAHIIVLDKPAALVVHPGSGVASGTLLNALLHHAPGLAGVPRAGIVHRLDKDTSGLLVVAKTLEAQTDLVRQLQARTVKRHYAALVHGAVAGGGCVDAPLGRHPTQRTKMAVVGAGRHAVTHFAPLERFARATLVQCNLETGRTHQIRVHMAHIGHPLIGDATYGRRKSACVTLDGFGRQALHAMRLGLLHPATHQAVEWEAPLPADFAALLERLRAESSATPIAAPRRG
jgi:23S rRNA pseudouridine1911/1915/1917 synthase